MRSRTFDGHAPQHALGSATQSAFDVHASHVAGSSATLVGIFVGGAALAVGAALALAASLAVGLGTAEGVALGTTLDAAGDGPASATAASR